MESKIEMYWKPDARMLMRALLKIKQSEKEGSSQRGFSLIELLIVVAIILDHRGDRHSQFH